ncbi:MAG: leucine-rich repeat protein, partial [Candidatus Gallimonas sp.]
MKRRIVKPLLVLAVFAVSVAALAISGCNKPGKAQATGMTVNGVLGEYVQNSVIDYDGITVTIVYSDGTQRTVPLSDPAITLTGGNTDAVGEDLNVTVTWREGEISFSKTLSYSVRQAKLTLFFGEGIYVPEGADAPVDRYEVSVGESVTDISEYRPIAEEEGMMFAGWFYDAELTRRVEYRIDEQIATFTDVTLYAGYDVDYTGILNYTVDAEKGEAKLTSFCDFDITELVIPKTVELYPVTAIGDSFCPEFFASWLSVKKLSFAEGSAVTTIGESAFRNVSSLNEIHLPEGLAVIGKNAFSGAGIRGEVKIPSSVRRIESYAFSGCYFITRFQFPADSKMLYIGDSAFSFCEALTEFSMPDGLTECGKDVFYYCTDLNKVYIGDSLRTLGVRPFYGADKIDDITVSPDNNFYLADNGSIYSKDMTQLVLYNYLR